MIEDKKDGIKIAINKEEAFWIESKKKCEEAINLAEKEIIINKHIFKLCVEKISHEQRKTNTSS